MLRAIISVAEVYTVKSRKQKEKERKQQVKKGLKNIKKKYGLEVGDCWLVVSSFAHTYAICQVYAT